VSCPYIASHLNFQDITNPTLLVLSGGASYGAWGAGVLTGWTDNAMEPRPEAFTVVTGISVGALQATPAFLGKAYDPMLEEFFTKTKDSDIFTAPNPLKPDAFQSREPLRQKINKTVTEGVVMEVANQENRELYVGTVNLDTSEFCPWNLSTIARKAKAASNNKKEEECWVQLFRDAIFAASGAPVIAPPVEIDSNACTGGPPKKMFHVDGGVRARVFISHVVSTTFISHVVSTTPVEPSLFVIVNGKPVTHPECVEDDLMSIAARTFEIIDHEAVFGALRALPNPVDLRISRIPDAYCLRFPSSKFDPFLMDCLYKKGQNWSKAQPIQWETTVPPQSVAVWPPPAGNPPVPCCHPTGECTCNQPVCVSPADECPP
jgi:predicted acylesterase/phospholipase RssA